MKIEIILIITLCFIIHTSSNVIEVKSDESRSERFTKMYFFEQFSKSNGSLSQFINNNKHKTKFITSNMKKIKYYYSRYLSTVRRHSSFSNLASNSSNTLNIRELGDEILYGKIGFGTPAQEINLAIDTGSGTLWTAGSQCPLSECPQGGYNYKKSSTSQYGGQTGSLDYGTDGAGTVNITSVTDTVTIASFSVPNQDFWFATSVDMEGYAQSGWNGILGVSYVSDQIGDTSNLINVLEYQGSISYSHFSYYLNDQDYWVGSKFIIGGIDSRYYTGNITYFSNIYSYAWVIEADYISIGGNQVTLNSALLDSGTSNVVGPKDVIASINGFLGEINPVCDLNTDLPQITISFSGVVYPIPKYLYSNSDVGGACVTPFQYQGQGMPFILGNTFFQNYYTVFDITNTQVGFATINHPTN